MSSSVLISVAQIGLSAALVFFTWKLWKATEALAASTKVSVQLQYRSHVVIDWSTTLEGTGTRLGWTPTATIKDKRETPLRIISVYKGSSNDTIEDPDRELNRIYGPAIRLRRIPANILEGSRTPDEPAIVKFSPIHPSRHEDIAINYEVHVWFRDFADGKEHCVSSICTYSCPTDGKVTAHPWRSFYDQQENKDPNAPEVPGVPAAFFRK